MCPPSLLLFSPERANGRSLSCPISGCTATGPAVPPDTHHARAPPHMGRPTPEQQHSILTHLAARRGVEVARGGGRSARCDRLALDHLAMAAEVERHTALAADEAAVGQTTRAQQGTGQPTCACAHTGREPRAAGGALHDTAGVGARKDTHEGLLADSAPLRQGDTRRQAEAHHQAHSSREYVHTRAGGGACIARDAAC
jgi:hypothetical protein